MLRILVTMIWILGIAVSSAPAFDEPKPSAALPPKPPAEPEAASPKNGRPRPTVTVLPRAGAPKPAAPSAPVAMAPRNDAELEKKLQQLAPPPPLKSGSAWHKRAALRLSHSPAADVARALSNFFAADGGVLVVPEPVSNSLLISAVPGALEEVERLAKALDEAPPMVRIDAAIVEVKLTSDKDAGASATAIGKDGIDAQIQSLKKSGELQVLCRPSIMTLENQPAYLQVGSREPVVTGTAMSSRGAVHSVTKENVGTILGVTPRRADDGRVVLQIDVESSQLGPAEEGVVISAPAQGPPIRAPRVSTMTVQSTLSVPDGQTARLGGLLAESKDRRTQIVLLVTPQVQRPENPVPVKGK